MHFRLRSRLCLSGYKMACYPLRAFAPRCDILDQRQHRFSTKSRARATTWLEKSHCRAEAWLTKRMPYLRIPMYLWNRESARSVRTACSIHGRGFPG